MPSDDKQAFVTGVVRAHGQRLQRFLARRLRQTPDDIADLAQEVYLRLMRVRDHEAIRISRQL